MSGEGEWTVTDLEASLAWYGRVFSAPYSTVVFRDPDNIQLEFIAT